MAHQISRRITPVSVSDPMLRAINAYRSGVDAFAAIPRGVITCENENEFVAATYGPAQDILLRNAPKVTTLAGVREAIRFAFEETAIIDDAVENALRSALDYLDRAA